MDEKYTIGNRVTTTHAFRRNISIDNNQFVTVILPYSVGHIRHINANDKGEVTEIRVEFQRTDFPYIWFTRDEAKALFVVNDDAVLREAKLAEWEAQKVRIDAWSKSVKGVR